MNNDDKMEDENDDQVTPTVSETVSEMDISEGRSLGKVTSSMDMSVAGERVTSSMDVSVGGDRTDSLMSIPPSSNDNCNLTDMEIEDERMDMPDYDRGDESDFSSPEKSVGEYIESMGPSAFFNTLDDDSPFDDDDCFAFPPDPRESCTSQVEGPETPRDYIPRTGPSDLLRALDIDPSYDDDGSSAYSTSQPNSARSEPTAPSIPYDVADEESAEEEIAEETGVSPRLKRKTAIRRRAGVRRTLIRPKTRRTKRRSRSTSSPRTKKASARTFPYMEESVAGPSVAGPSGSRTNVPNREAKIVTLHLKKYLQGILEAPVIPDHSDPFRHPATDYQVNYVMKKKEYKRLQELDNAANLVKLFFVFEHENTITQVFSLDDTLTDMIYFIYMWYKSLYDVELTSKIPMLTIREPSRRNISKHSVDTTVRRLRIPTETKVYVEFIPKLDRKMKPIDLHCC